MRKKLRKIINKGNINKPIRVKKLINEKFETFSASSLYGFTKLASEKLIKDQYLFYMMVKQYQLKIIKLQILNFQNQIFY